MVNQYSVRAEEKLFLSSLLKIISEKDLAQQLATAATNSGTKLLALLRERAKKATAQDQALVKTQFNRFVEKGHTGQISLASFNTYYKGLIRHLRVLSPAQRSGTSDADICEILNIVMFKDPSVNSLYENKLEVKPPNGDLSKTLELIRELLRSREVRRELCEPSSNWPDFHSLLAKAQAGDSKALKQAKALLAAADPTKHQRNASANFGDGANSGAHKKVKVPRDKNGKVIKWVPGMDLCGCSANGKSDGKHLLRDCPNGATGLANKAFVLEHMPAAEPAIEPSSSSASVQLDLSSAAAVTAQLHAFFDESAASTAQPPEKAFVVEHTGSVDDSSELQAPADSQSAPVAEAEAEVKLDAVPNPTLNTRSVASENPKGSECLASTRMVRGQSAKGPPDEPKGEIRGTGPIGTMADSDVRDAPIKSPDIVFSPAVPSGASMDWGHAVCLVLLCFATFAAAFAFSFCSVPVLTAASTAVGSGHAYAASLVPPECPVLTKWQRHPSWPHVLFSFTVLYLMMLVLVVDAGIVPTATFTLRSARFACFTVLHGASRAFAKLRAGANLVASLASCMIVLALLFISFPRAGGVVASHDLQRFHTQLRALDDAGLVTRDARFTVDAHLLHRADAALLGNSLNHAAVLELQDVMQTPCASSPVANPKSLKLIDSGSGVHALPSSSSPYAIQGSVRPNTTAISTANGVTIPQFKCDARIPAYASDGSRRTLLLTGALILDHSEHVLISAGRLAAEQHITTVIGAGTTPSSLILSDKTTIPVANLGVLILPDTKPAAMGAPVHGAEGRQDVDYTTLHARFNHRPHRVLSRLLSGIRDAPTAWSRALKQKHCGDGTCDSCLRGKADALPSASHVPQATSPGELVSYDIWQAPVGHLFGGQKYVVGFHDQYSALDRVYLLRHKSEFPEALQQYAAFCRSYRVELRRLHSDNEAVLNSRRVAEWCRQHRVRHTTSAPRVARGNGTIENRFRVMGNDTRTSLAHCMLPTTCWWLALRASVLVSYILPIAGGDPGETPWLRFTGKRPSARHIRVFGCLAYYKVIDVKHKLQMRARRAVYVGQPEDQTGYMLFCLETRKLVVSPHVRFVEDRFPGLSRWPQPGEPVADDLFRSTSSAPPGTPPATPPPMPSPTDETAPADAHDPPPDPLPPPLAEDDDTDVAPTTLHAPAVAPTRRSGRQRRAVPRDDELVHNYSATFAVPESGGFYLYLGSGPQRPSGVDEQMRAMGGAPVVLVDIKVGGYGHDLADAQVAASLLSLARIQRCLGVLVSIPCRTWSVARSLDAGGGLEHSKPLRSREHPLGIPRADGSLPPAVEHANRMAENAATIMQAVYEHGGVFIAESPPPRGEGSQFAIPGRESHTGQFEHPAFRQLISRSNASLVNFDQCRTRNDPHDSPQKTTTLLASPNVASSVRSRFATLVCNHPPHTHASMTGVDATGELRSTQWESYSPMMNRLLAECLHEGSPTASAPCEPCVDPLQDWCAFYAMTAARADDAPHEGGSTDALMAVARFIGDGFRSLLYYTGVDGMCFAAPREVDADSPSYAQAMKGPERELWLKACNAELDSFQRHDVAEPVLEDTLPSWDPARRFATEVVNILWVLKRKYVDGILDKYKARGVYDGRMQKERSTSILDTFAPAVRHTTHKLLVGRAVALGATSTTLSSRAYIDRLCDKYLPQPLSSYPTFDTPCAPDLRKHYEVALQDRHTVCPRLAASYPRKVGALIYAHPASRADCSYTIGMLARCLTFPTADMDAAADRCIAYLGQHADHGIRFSRSTPSASSGLHAYSDSDWSTAYSTSGWAIFYCGAVIGYGSKRQHSIALSSTEAEIMAASQAGAEIIYFRGLLREMGADMSEPTVLYVDNSGAIELSKDLKSCQRSRHIERRYLKIREWVAQGEIVVKYVATKDNHADVLTKPLDAASFRRHADALMGRSPASVRAAAGHPVRQRTFDVESAYLKGKFDSDQVLYARPPPGARHYVNGVPVIWRLKVPLYGEADAGRIWNRTLVKQLVHEQRFIQSQYDPCYFFKTLADNTRMDMVMYVDDGYVIDAFSQCADAELKALHDAFTITIKDAQFFLGNNITIAAN